MSNSLDRKQLATVAIEPDGKIHVSFFNGVPRDPFIARSIAETVIGKRLEHSEPVTSGHYPVRFRISE